MVNFVEMLIAVTVVSLVGAVIARLRQRRELARRLGLCALACGVVAAALEVYLRL